MESKNKKEERRPAALKTANTVLKIREHAERELQEANKVWEQDANRLTETLVIMRATLESTADAILVNDENGVITTFNRKYLSIWSISEEMMEKGSSHEILELLSRNFDDPLRFLNRIEEIAATTEDSFDLLELKDGRILERYSTNLSIKEVSIGRVWNFRDVSERQRAEIVLRRLAAIVESSDDAIIGKDLNGIITSWNSGAGRIFGYTADEMIGTSIMQLIPPDRQNEEVTILTRIRSGERLDHFETMRLSKNGRLLNVSITVSPIKDAFGNVIGASKIARDVTLQKKIERALATANFEKMQLLESEREARTQAERASRMKDEFLATLSHELRTPLNAVLGWTNVLQQGQLKGGELKQGLDTIERNARIQAKIIEDLLDMSGIISGKVRLDIQRVDLPTILEESIDTVRTAAELKNIRLTSAIDPLAEKISGDPNRLQQVFWNLLNNAIKFTPKNGKIHVTLERLNSHLNISIVDTGEGILPEFLPYVFDRFQQADASITRHHGGLGLGLAIVKQLIELHGGSVSVKSAGSGLGATFTIHLPLSAGYQKPESDRQPSQTPSSQIFSWPEVSLNNVHVLVVDDEIDAQELVKRFLEMAGATVSTASSAAEATRCMSASCPDVLICDVGMPVEDGYAFIQKLRALSGTKRSSIPAVALTAYARPEDRTKAIRSGFQNHLSKPVDPGELLAVVSSLAERSMMLSVPTRDENHENTI